jgi:hypothetical protein
VISNCKIKTIVCNSTVNVASSLIAVNLTNTLELGFFIMSLGYGGCVTTMPWRCTPTLYYTRNGRTWTLTWPLAVAAPGATNGTLGNFNTVTISSTCPAINIVELSTRFTLCYDMRYYYYYF